MIGHTEVASGQTIALLAMRLRTVWNQEGFFDYHARWYEKQVWGDDSWRYVNGQTTARYPNTFGAPGGMGCVPDNFMREP